MTGPTENGTELAAHGGGGDEADGPEPLPYERVQRRLRVDGVAFGAAVKRFREAEGWSVRTLSKKSGVPLTTVAKLERGETAAPDVEVASALAYLFGYGSPGAMLGAGATARRTPRPDDPAGALPITLEHLVESLLRAIQAVHGDAARPLPAPLPGDAPDPEAGAAAAAEGALRLPTPAGVNLYVPLVVLFQPRTVG